MTDSTETGLVERLNNPKTPGDRLRVARQVFAAFVGEYGSDSAFARELNFLTETAQRIDFLEGELTSGEAAHCYGHCGWLGWTFKQYGRIVHKHVCPRRGAAYCQSHPEACETRPWQDRQSLQQNNDEKAGS